MSRLIAHQISKQQHHQQAEVHLRDKVLPTDTPVAETLLAQLRAALAERNPQAGRFTTPADEQPAFQRSLLRYMGAKSDAEFVAFSQRTTRLLRTVMEREPLATGGYLLFAEHEHNDETFLLLVLLSTHAQPCFDAELNLQSALTLDFEHLRHGVRVRCSSVPANEDGVVHFVSRSAEGVSNYFQTFLDCEPLTDSAAQGRYLLTALGHLATELNLQRDDVLQRTYSYWTECRRGDRMMTMTGLANLLVPDNPENALRFLSDPATRLAGEFSAPPPSVMKHYIKFEFNESGLKLAFDREKWLDYVTTKDKTVTIRNAPATLIAQLKSEKE